ncbi:methylenetetrahydrofolate reductase [Teladorsagia circumcincta]|uniref:Methylenetetrahydrofolate reductase n=1 Tax=Teladorsagia circumcincta TaxID=45464 RepID=A0A2G9V5Q3_TELCI|nr:methylenetetrahydrofolate reductase [Teladorsagia circumcincta]
MVVAAKQNSVSNGGDTHEQLKKIAIPYVLDRFNEGGPLFVDITWHLGSDPANMNKETSSSSIAAGCLDYCRVDTMLHMTCAQYSKEQTIKHLEQSKSVGLRNILALRGDLPIMETDGVPVYKYRALDMIRWIREEFGDYFTVCCSGYPLGHPEAPSYKADLLYLKSKCEAGAQFIITQLFFEAEVFEEFVRDCREIGITVPIIPGIMPIMAIEMCRRILSNGSAPSIHLYTMNREGACREILQELGLWHKRPMRTLPWKPHGSIHPLRCKEDVRPIFWSARPKSYIYRTRDWDDFPNGRWGNSSSPAFGDLQDYYLFYLKAQTKKEDLLKMYGEEIACFDDVKKVFTNFISQSVNDQGVKVCTGEYLGILTVNSQPSVNGAPSTDPLVGWGKPGGYCYQKVNHFILVDGEH